MSTWLTEISMLELSPVKRPANKKRAILRKSEDTMIENLTARLEKAELDEAQKQAVMAALDALEMAREGMEPEAFDAAMSALASLMMPEVPEEEPMDADADEGPEADMVEEEASVEEEDKGMEEKGDMEKEEHEEKACDEMKKSEDDFQALLKARDDEVAELKKSLSDKEELIKSKSYLDEASAYDMLPTEKSDLADLIRLVDESGKDSVKKCLGSMLQSHCALIEKSEAFSELGGSGDRASDRSGVMGKIEAMADSIVQKSAAKMTKEQAVARVLEQNPALYTEWVNQG